jgi:hypothetical protein
MVGEDMPGGNFDDTLNVAQMGKGAALASGPLADSVVNVHVMCAWVVQRNGGADAIANEMGAPGGPEGLKLINDSAGKPVRWEFPLAERLGSIDFDNGWGTAMAIGVFEDAANNKRAFYWAETVQLVLVADGPGPRTGGMAPMP